MFDRSNVKDVYSLSPMQEGMLFHHILDEKTTASFMQIVFTLAGEIELPLLEASLNKVIERHDILRTFFSYHKTKKPRQIVLKKWLFHVEFQDISHLEEQTKPACLENFKKRDRERGFNLQKEIPMRVTLIKAAPRSYHLVWSSHHIILEGWCQGIIFKEFLQVLDQLKNGTPLQLKPVVPYSRYIQWLERQDKEKSLGFWRQYLEGYEKPAVLPQTVSGPGPKQFQIENNTLSISGPLQEDLIAVKNLNQVTLNTVFQAIWGILLQKYNNTGDVVFGVIVSGRSPEVEGIETMMGLFINLIPLRISIEKGDHFAGVLKRVQEKAVLLKNFEFLPIADVQAQSPLKRELINHIVVFENYPTPEVFEDYGSENRLGFKVTGVDPFIHTEYDLNLLVSQEEDARLNIKFNYNAAVYPHSLINALASQVIHIIRQVVKNPGIEVKKITLLPEEEKQQVLFEFNRTELDYPEDQTIHGLFEEQAAKTPDRIAVSAAVPMPMEIGGGDNRHVLIFLSFRELNRESNRLARLLQKQGVGPGAIVAVSLDNTPELIISILSILKAGGTYLPIGADLPGKRIITMLDDSRAALFLSKSHLVSRFEYIPFQHFEQGEKPIPVTTTLPRQQIRDLDSLQVPDRSLIDYEKYSPYIAQAMVKNSIILQFSRGCVYDCAYCVKIWSDGYVHRSAGNMLDEILMYYRMGVRRFGFADDLPNFNIKESARLFKLIIQQGLQVHLHFPNGIRGDILTRDYIDLMVEAGTVSMDLALETSSKRLQRLIRKNLQIDRLRENMEYIVSTYPQVVLGTQIIHGLPGETGEEARNSLDFIKSLQWLHFPYIHLLTIYPNTPMARLAKEHGISAAAIRRSAHLGYHEIPETIHFPGEFTRQYRSEFLEQYFMNRRRLKAVLPWQMKVLTEDELVQKYNNYLPVEINSLADLLKYAGIARKEVKGEFLPADFGSVTDLNKKLSGQFPGKQPRQDALKILLLDLSQHFSSHSQQLTYDVKEPPLGLMYLLTHLNRKFQDKISGKIAKSRMDFDNFDELRVLIREFKPDVIGVRSLNFYKDFFHQTISMIRQWGVTVTVIAGGPYAVSSYTTLLQDRNIDLAVLGEGEITLAQLVEQILANQGKLPAEEILKKIPGLALVEQKHKTALQHGNRAVFLLDQVRDRIEQEAEGNLDLKLKTGRKADRAAYIIYTSGSTGVPKGVIIRHNSLVNQVTGLRERLGPDARVPGALNYMMLASVTFDVSLMHIFLALTTGQKLHLVSEQIKKDPFQLWQFIYKNNINVLNMVPAFMRALLPYVPETVRGNKKIQFKYLFLGGDVLDKELYRKIKETFAAEKIINIYGPTETTINATLYECHPGEEHLTIPIGKPLPNYRVHILDRDLNVVPVGAVGELFISGPGMAQGYLNNPGLTFKKFVNYKLQNTNYKQITKYKSQITNKAGKTVPGKNKYYLYRTGDQAHWWWDGNIEFLGRIDRQVKIRGFRIETGEIESHLRDYPYLKEAIVAMGEEDNGEKYLAAYVVFDPGTPAAKMEQGELQHYLSGKLPGYMIPAYFNCLKKIPLTSAGKVDRNALPSPKVSTNKQLTGPRDEKERKLAEIWAEVLGLEPGKIGINEEFFKSGGHSLKAINLISKIHKVFDRKIPLATLFENPTIRKLSRLLENIGTDSFVSLEPTEKKEYYPLSHHQKSIYTQQQKDPENLGYNWQHVFGLKGHLERERVDRVFRQLIRRHGGFRTAFVVIHDEPVQRIHDRVEFAIDYIEAAEEQVNEIARRLIRPFDLSIAPLLRLAFIKVAENKHICMFDMHHTIYDGVSPGILNREFLVLFNGETLPALKLQYTDFVVWQNSQAGKNIIAQQETYWKNVFAGQLPVLNLTTDFPRPRVQEFKGDSLLLIITPEEIRGLKIVEAEENTTLFTVLFSLFYILIFKLTGQEDIIMGTPVAGRRHTDLQQVIGMFVNTLAIRNFPGNEITFSTFLKEVKKNTLEAFENQEYPFEELMKILPVKRDMSRHPLFDVMFVMHTNEIPNIETPGTNAGDLQMEPFARKKDISHFDLLFAANEGENSLEIIIEYSTSLFKRETIEKISGYFSEILKQVLENREIKLEDIKITYEYIEAESRGSLAEEDEWLS